jgi:heme/copper-type cytochrome/quinol oxidase subunit 3
MTLMRMPMFSVATFVNSFLILFAFPSLTAAIAMLYLDRRYGTAFFNPDKGGDPLVWQHLFWFFGHPEVYILILPAFGMVSEVVPVFSRKPLFGRTSMIVMIGVIGFFGFAVWAHHMFATGLPTVFNSIMAATSMLIAIPTGVKIFNWLATMWGGSLRLKTPLLFCCGMIALFTVGGITGVSLAVVPFDWQVTDTYYVVAHFHNVLIAGTLFGVFAGFYYWFPKMSGRLLDDRLGRWHFWLILVGFLVTFMPMYALGFLGMPRRVSTYASDIGWNTANLISSIGGYIIATSLVIFLVNVLRSRRRGAVAGDNPWDAWTLEWATGSPPPNGNFVSLPPVSSPRPLWDLEQASSGANAGDVELDASLAASLEPQPDASPGSPSDAPPEPPAAGAAALEAGDHMTAVPLFAALAVLVMASGLVWSLVLTALGFAMLLVVMAVWMSPGHPWPAVPPLPGERFSAAGVATLAFIGSESIFFVSLIAAAVHLRLHVGPLDAGRDLAIELPTINTAILVLSGITAHYALARYRQGRARAALMHFGFTIALGIAFLCGQAWEYTHMGFGLADGVVGSTFYTLTGFHGMHVAAGILALVFLFVRVRRDAARGTAAASQQALGFAEAATFYWHFVDAVWVAVFVVVYLL